MSTPKCGTGSGGVHGENLLAGLLSMTGALSLLDRSAQLP